MKDECIYLNGRQTFLTSWTQYHNSVTVTKFELVKKIIPKMHAKLYLASDFWLLLISWLMPQIVLHVKYVGKGFCVLLHRVSVSDQSE